MSKRIELAVIIVIALLIGAWFLFPKLRTAKREVSIFWPAILVVVLWHGFALGWSPRNLVELGIVLVLWVTGVFKLLQRNRNQ